MKVAVILVCALIVVQGVDVKLNNPSQHEDVEINKEKNNSENDDAADNDGPGNDNPAEAPEICAREGSNGVLVAHEYCNRFYKCAYGKPVALRCYGDLLFNPRKDICDWPKNVDCGDRTIPAPDDSDSGNGDNGDNGADDDKGDDENGGGEDNDGPGNDNPAEAPEICAREGSNGVLVAHEYCNRFYKCAYGVPVALRCYGDLLFNPRKNICDWPTNVDCGDRTIPPPDDSDNGNGDNGDNGADDGENGGGEDNGGPGNDNPAEAPEICAREGSNGVLVAHEYCNRFYKCAYGKPVALRCYGDLLFNPRKDICDWPKNVDCGDRTIPAPDDSDSGNGDNGDNGADDDKGDDENSGGEDNDGPGNDNPAEAPEICAREGSNGVLVAHEYCNRFYKCAYGVPVALRCYGDLLFNPRKDICDWPKNVDCGDRTIPAPDDSDSGNSDNGDNGADDDKGDDENSGGEDNDGPGNDNPAEAPEICAREGSNGVLVAHEYCNRFYKCAYGVPVALRCYGDLLFNPRKNICDWPTNVDCGDRTIPPPDDSDNGNGDNGDNGADDGENGGGEDNGGPGNDNPAEAPEICAREGSNGVLVAHEYCNRFYKCAYGKPVALRCYGDLLFNPRKDICDWPKNVDCGDRTIPAPDDSDSGNGDNGDNGADDDKGDDENGGGEDNDGPGNDNPAEAPEICAREGSNGVLVAHEYCNRFYKCAYGVPVALRCYGDLLFNPRKNICDWPTNVDCGDRTIPPPDDSDNGNGDNGDNGADDDKGDDENGGDEDNGGPGNDNPAEAPEICAREGLNGVLVAHEYCNRFYKCAYGVPVALRCYGDLLFNPRINICDWPKNVDCGDRTIPAPDDSDNGNGDNGDNGADDDKGDDENGGDKDNGGPGNDNPAEAPEICAREGSNGVLVAHEYCNRFYKCAYGMPVALRCYGDLLFNPRKNICDWPTNVDCGDRTIPAPDDSDNGNGDNGDNGADDDKGDDENGGDEDNGGPGNDNPAEAPEICAREGSNGVLVAHEYCNRFYKCAYGVPVALRCYGDLLFNPRINICDWPKNVDCGDRTIPAPDDSDNGNGDNGDNGADEDKGDDENGGDEDNGGPGNDNPAEAPEICAREGSNGVLVAHEYCNRFYKCAYGEPVALRCYGDLLFNPRKDICDWPKNVDCGDRTIPAPDDNDNGNNDNEGETGGIESNDGPGNDDPAKAPEICAREGSDGVLVAHEYCNRFYKCFNGNLFAFICPADLLYSPRKEQCDWPGNVNCRERIIAV